ncbi:MAG: peptidase S10, partial [Acidobacteria bacterium]|nr:peptidase S10 [Acidobacteriota bacterium]NIM60350.1 peptidase S10 [Acidobacteriota bacterium]NIO60351.1 peptidase S10 [Acidobacteriota bacterium]NIQ31406.1 peptidase S10 [Acidobacteriota bacterium]NIQ86632.1 peptidase S10 [Acidobacteriota bacterium]
MAIRSSLCVCFLTIFCAAPALADKPASAEKPAEIPPAQVFTTSHSGKFGGAMVKYIATAGETYLKDEDGKPKASIFSIAYVQDGVTDPTKRPVTFLWNGGPGSSSVWLHMGAFGPKRVVVPSDAKDDGAPPFLMEDNPLTILDVTDLVFVDPVGTGYSRPLGEHEGKEFWGVSEDAQSVAEFIRSWITTNKRWASPKYIGGESYGTTRSAAVIHELEGRFDDVAVNGLILISTVMDFYTSGFQTGNELGYITYLPTMAATAAYHGKVDPPPADLKAFLEEAREFAVEEYAPALLRGNTLPDDERARIRKRLSYFTGISEDYFRLSDLRITDRRFYKELLRDEGLVVGRLDGRFTGRDMDDAGETPESDPSFYGIDGAY